MIYTLTPGDWSSLRDAIADESKSKRLKKWAKSMYATKHYALHPSHLAFF